MQRHSSVERHCAVVGKDCWLERRHHERYEDRDWEWLVCIWVRLFWSSIWNTLCLCCFVCVVLFVLFVLFCLFCLCCVICLMSLSSFSWKNIFVFFFFRQSLQTTHNQSRSSIAFDFLFCFLLSWLCCYFVLFISIRSIKLIIQSWSYHINLFHLFFFHRTFYNMLQCWQGLQHLDHILGARNVIESSASDPESVSDDDLGSPWRIWLISDTNSDCSNLPTGADVHRNTDTYYQINLNQIKQNSNK